MSLLKCSYSQHAVKICHWKHRINRKKDAEFLEAEANAFWCKLCNKLISYQICSFLVASQTAEIRSSRHLGRTKAWQWIFLTDSYIRNELHRVQINSIKLHIAQSSCPILCLTPSTIAFEVFLLFGLIAAHKGFHILEAWFEKQYSAASCAARPTLPHCACFTYKVKACFYSTLGCQSIVTRCTQPAKSW